MVFKTFVTKTLQILLWTLAPSKNTNKLIRLRDVTVFLFGSLSPKNFHQLKIVYYITGMRGHSPAQ